MATGNVEIDGILWRCSCPPAAAKSRGSSRNRKMWQEPLQPSFLGFSRLCTRNDMPILPAQLSLHYSDPCYTLLNRRLTLQSWTRTAPLWRPTFERLAAAISNWLIQCLPSLLRMWLIISPVDVAALCPAWSRSEPVRKYDQSFFLSQSEWEYCIDFQIIICYTSIYLWLFSTTRTLFILVPYLMSSTSSVVIQTALLRLYSNEANQYRLFTSSYGKLITKSYA